MSANDNAISYHSTSSVGFHLTAVLLLGCFVSPGLAHQPSRSPATTSPPAVHSLQASGMDQIAQIKEMDVTEVVGVPAKRRDIFASILSEITVPAHFAPLLDAFAAHVASNNDTSFAALNQHIRPPQLIARQSSDPSREDHYWSASTSFSDTPWGIDQHTDLPGFFNNLMDQQLRFDEDHLFLRSNFRSDAGRPTYSLRSRLSELWEGFWSRN